MSKPIIIKKIRKRFKNLGFDTGYDSNKEVILVDLAKERLSLMVGLDYGPHHIRMVLITGIRFQSDLHNWEQLNRLSLSQKFCRFSGFIYNTNCAGVTTYEVCIVGTVPVVKVNNAMDCYEYLVEVYDKFKEDLFSLHMAP